LTFEFDLHGVKVNQHGKYLAERPLTSKFTVRIHNDRHTHTTERSTWTTKVVESSMVIGRVQQAAS